MCLKRVWLIQQNPIIKQRIWYKVMYKREFPPEPVFHTIYQKTAYSYRIGSMLKATAYPELIWDSRHHKTYKPGVHCFERLEDAKKMNSRKRSSTAVVAVRVKGFIAYGQDETTGHMTGVFEEATLVKEIE